MRASVRVSVYECEWGGRFMILNSFVKRMTFIYNNCALP